MADNNPLDTLFTFTNNGPLTLYDLEISCELWDGTKRLTLSNIAVLRLGEGPATLNPTIDQLTSGQSATRDCGAEGAVTGLNPQRLRIDFSISYRWLDGLISGSMSRHFDTRTVGNKIIMVPDVEPSWLG